MCAIVRIMCGRVAAGVEGWNPERVSLLRFLQLLGAPPPAICPASSWTRPDILRRKIIDGCRSGHQRKPDLNLKGEGKILRIKSRSLIFRQLEAFSPGSNRDPKSRPHGSRRAALPRSSP